MPKNGFPRTTPRTGGLLPTALLVTGLAVAAGGLAGCDEIDRAGRSSDRQKTEHQDKSYQRKVTRIEVELDAGDLTVTRGDADEVTVDRDLRWEHTKPVLREEWSGDTLRISAVCPDDDNCSVDYKLRVPEAVVVRADTEAGDLSIRGVARDLDLTSLAGDITVEDATGRIRIQGDSGNITGRGLRSANVDVQTKDGEINLRFEEPPTSASAITDAGAIRIGVPRGGDYRVKATTKDGNRNVDVPASATGRHSIVARVTDGNVTVSYA